MPEEGLLSQLKPLVVGKPIPSHLAHHERLSRFTGLAVLSSDPLSSVAYATEEILLVLILAGVSALSLSSRIAFVVRHDPRGRRVLVPPNDPCLSKWRRGLHRRKGQSWRDPSAD